ICTLDERGKVISSPEFSDLLIRWRDSGRSNVTFVIGGADGIAKSLREQADYSLSFGKMVWPHMLARVMLCEQLYRAASIAAKLPYHRA
ncbi:MAG: 23S rRNA (pseudouridine(1915)-N(3))-methyltransferase RlmH, partial [Litoreibacter sp.]|nr:23S rRNA (pseudouridine(1915)-N(3))-methyltransferase RlmH [Litoreibacter sp.]